MRLWLYLGLLFIWCAMPVAAAPAQAPAQATAATEQVQARLLADHQVVSPGQRLRIALQQKIIPQWHTYWKNPGDSGEATQIHWQLPAGVTMSALEWPAPQRFVLGPITNYGYSDEVSLLQWLSLPSDWPVGQPLQLRATVDWLVCAEECIPQSVQLALTLPVAAQSVPAAAADRAVIHASEARLPQPLPFQSHLMPAQQGGYQLVVSGLPAGVTLTDSYFFASRWGFLAQSQPQHWQVQQGALRLQLPVGENPLQTGDTLDGVLLLHEAGVDSARGYTLSVAMAAAPAGGIASGSISSAVGAPLADPAPAGSGLSVAMALLLAFAGGFLLNLMPCVFPVLSMKALALLAHSEQPLAVQRRHGWAYTTGIVASFIGFALLLIGFKAAGTELGWGFQFQSPLFVLLMTCLLFAVGLNLSGVFEISGRFNGTGQHLAAQQGYRGSFFTGVLATVVATPCTAPLMAAALGFAMTQPPLSLLLVFVSLGLGLASPVLLLSYWPALQRRLPKPGPWMVIFRQLLAFPMYGAAIWLAWVLAQLQGADSWWWLLVLLLLQSFALWWLGLSQQRASANWQPVTALLLLVLALSWGVLQLNQATTAPVAPEKTAAASVGPEFEPYSDARLAELRAAGTPVFVNFTAAWCLSCLVNEKVALNTAVVRQAFTKQQVVYLKADWTARDEQIRQTLARYGRSGVPLYLFFPAGQQQVVELPQILTPDLLVRTVSSVN